MELFGKELVTQNQLAWALAGNIAVTVAGITFHGLQFHKECTISGKNKKFFLQLLTTKGMNGFQQIQVLGFDLPANDPRICFLLISWISSISEGGGIEVVMNVSMVNPSIVSIQLGDVEFEVSYQNATMGTIGASAVTIQPGTS